MLVLKRIETLVKGSKFEIYGRLLYSTLKKSTLLLKNAGSNFADLYRDLPLNSIYVAPALPQSNPSFAPEAKRGKIYFRKAPGGFAKTREKQDLYAFLKKQGYSKLGVVGDHPICPSLAQKMKAALPNTEIKTFYWINDLFCLQNNSDLDAIVLVSTKRNALRFLRTIVHTVLFQGDLVIPCAETRELATTQFESPKPLVFFGYTYSGTLRFYFSLKFLLDKMKIQYVDHPPFNVNVRYVHGLKGTDGYSPPNSTIENISFLGRALSLDYHECLLLHEWAWVSHFENADCRLIVLMRDPRDMANSMYWRTLGEDGLEGEEHLMRILKGYTRFCFNRPVYVLQWPGIERIANNYLEAFSQKNAFVLRFEDLHRDDVAATKKLMTDLQLYPNPFIDLNDDLFRKAAHLGSFEHQTGGKYKRGEDRKIPFGRMPGWTERQGNPDTSSCRKGVIGDWRSSFTPKAVEYVKETIGQQLIDLGYERDFNWQ